MRNGTPHNISDIFLPQWSAMEPAMGPPNMAPTEAKACRG